MPIMEDSTRWNCRRKAVGKPHLSVVIDEPSPVVSPCVKHPRRQLWLSGRAHRHWMAPLAAPLAEGLWAQCTVLLGLSLVRLRIRWTWVLEPRPVASATRSLLGVTLGGFTSLLVTLLSGQETGSQLSNEDLLHAAER
jgi:hypothetical protein